MIMDHDGRKDGPEPVVKLEPPEDVKLSLDFFNSSSISSASNLWPYLLKTVRHKYQKEHGRKMDAVKMTRLLLLEVERLMEEVSSFVQSCCNDHPEEDGVNVIDISERLSLGVTSKRIGVNDLNVIPTTYKDTLFGPLQISRKEIDIMDVEQSIFQDDDDDDDDLPNFPESMDLPMDDFKMEEPFPPISMSGYPEPTLVPGKEGGKIKTFYKCDKCHKSFPKRKRYYNHKSNGKCTIEPKWIRWHKNHKRVECAHPDCTNKTEVNYTYPGLMKHIIEMHTVQEDSTIQCPDCPLKFPLKAALKYHQEMAHQAHAKICQVCGKVVRDMRKHRLIHTGEKPFQCDRCSYRCARSSSLKRHLATHLNATSILPAPLNIQQHQTLEEPKFSPAEMAISSPPINVQQEQEQQVLSLPLQHHQIIGDHEIHQQHQLQDHNQQQQHDQHAQLAYDQLGYRAMKFA